MSWFAGLSLGATLGIVLLVFVGLAIFVRTDFFQTRLKDQIVQSVEKNIEAKIEYQEARISLFRLFPKVQLNQVVVFDPQSKLAIPIREVSVSISLFYSLPLLAFQTIHISQAKISGLSFELQSLKSVENWLNRLRPKKGAVIPTQFQTRIEELRFEDLALRLDLKADDLLKRELQGDLNLREFSIRLDRTGIEAFGQLDIIRLKSNAIRLSNISLKLHEFLLSQSRIDDLHLSATHLDDFLELRGRLGSWQSPDLNLVMQGLVRLENYSFLKGFRGEAAIDMKLLGPWQSVKGHLHAGLKGADFWGTEVKEAKTRLKIDFPRVEIESFDGRAFGGEIKARGNGFWDDSQTSKIQIESKNIELGQVLRLVDPDFRDWEASVQTKGQLEFLGAGFENLQFRLEELEAKNFVIKNPNQSILILEVPKVNASGQLSHHREIGSMNIQVVTDFSRGALEGAWQKGRFDMSWQFELLAGNWGRFYEREVFGIGKIPGAYGGRVGQMELLIQPNLKTFKLNDFDFKNLRGELRYKNRKLFGSPLQSEGLKISGGLDIQPGKLPTLFSDLRVEMSQLSLQDVWSLIGLDPDFQINGLGGRLSGGLELNGWVQEPKGFGNVLVQELRIRGRRPVGRLAKFNWAWDRKDIRVRDFYFETSRDGGGIRGEVDLRDFHPERVRLRGVKTKYSDLSILFDFGFKMQSLINFSVDFDRQRESFQATASLFETHIGTFSKPASEIRILATGPHLEAQANFFKDEIILEAKPNPSGQIAVDLKINKFNLSPHLFAVAARELSIPMFGSGTCLLSVQSAIGRLGYEYLIHKPDNLECRFDAKETKVIRASTVLHEVPSFRTTLQYSPEKGFSLETSPIQIRTQGEKLQMEIFFEGKNRFRIPVSGGTRLEAISYLIPFLSRSDGNLQIQGVFDERGFSGAVDLKNGLLLFQKSPLVFRNVSAGLISQQSRIDIQNFSAETRDGSVEVRGGIQLGQNFEVQSGLLSADLTGLMIEPQAGFRFRTSGPLTLKIEDSKGELEGRLSVIDGSFRRRLNLRTDLLKVFQPRDERYRFVEKQESIYESWTLAIQLNSLEPLMIRNNVIDASVEFNMEVKGTMMKPRLAGRLSINSGLFSFNNRRFSVQSGSIQFSDPLSNIPRYDVRAETEIGDYRVFGTFQGDASEQKIIYSSEPPLTEKEILALVAYGTPPGQTENLDQGDPFGAAAMTGISIVTGQLQDTLEGALSGDLGVRRFQIYPNYYEQTKRTELQFTVGTDLIQNRLELNYSKFLWVEGGHEVQLGFRVNRNIYLVGSWRDSQREEDVKVSGEFGGDLFFRFEFE